jgi:hypothetical protein
MVGRGFFVSAIAAKRNGPSAELSNAEAILGESRTYRHRTGTISQSGTAKHVPTHWPNDGQKKRPSAGGR